MGNAGNLAARSQMWRDVLEELEDKECVGTAIPIVCQQHSDDIKMVSKPGQLPRIAPDGMYTISINISRYLILMFALGGCMRQCNARLKCGHLCPYKVRIDPRLH